jgi:ABC-2 type transport system permease protein
MVDAVRFAFVGQSDMAPAFSALIISSLAVVLLLVVTYLFKIGYKVKS